MYIVRSSGMRLEAMVKIWPDESTAVMCVNFQMIGRHSLRRHIEGPN